MTKDKDMTIISTKKYLKFVDSVLSGWSKDHAMLVDRMNTLSADFDMKVPQILTGAVGLASESGEVAEIVKKILFQGKKYDEESIFHLKREMGDVLFYFNMLCLALDVSIDDIMEINVNKLQNRYPSGFTVSKSENRQEYDV